MQSRPVQHPQLQVSTQLHAERCPLAFEQRRDAAARVHGPQQGPGELACRAPAIFARSAARRLSIAPTGPAEGAVVCAAEGTSPWGTARAAGGRTVPITSPIPAACRGPWGDAPWSRPRTLRKGPPALSAWILACAAGEGRTQMRREDRLARASAAELQHLYDVHAHESSDATRVRGGVYTQKSAGPFHRVAKETSVAPP